MPLEYRADHVGSLLRPAQVVAGASFRGGKGAASKNGRRVHG